MNELYSDKERIKLTPKDGFELVGIDFFAADGDKLYKVKHFDMYSDALNEKKSKKRPDDYLVLYMDAGGQYCYR